MLVRFRFTEGKLYIKRSRSKKVYSDSQLFYDIKKILNSVVMITSKYGVFIKKLMYKDGHMVADTQYYIRSQKPTSPEKTYIMIHDPSYAIRSLYEDYNKNEFITLDITF